MSALAVRRGVLSAVVVVVLASCSSSHTLTSCPGPAPMGCQAPDPSGCCTPVVARCVDDRWICPMAGSGSFSCEGTCGVESCASPAPRCFQDLGGGCCGEEVAATCVTPFWSCSAPGSVGEAECTAHVPECGACESLTEAECIASPDCGPLYDDLCCPLCLPTGVCADCSQPAMYRCGSIAEACADDPPVCGLGGRWVCTGGTADCTAALPAANGRCDVPGCVQAVEVGCIHCEPTCVPVTGVTCTATCDIVPPPCVAGMVPEGDGACYTGRCIAASACEPAPVVGP